MSATRALHRDVAAALDRVGPEAAWDVAAAALDSEHSEVRRYARRLLGHLAPRLSEAAWGEDRTSRAARAAITPPPRAGAVGRVAFPAVRGSAGRFVEAIVERLPVGPDRVLGPGPEAEGAAREALAAAREKMPSETALSVRFDPPSGWEGASCGLAVALAACSALGGLPVPATVCASARVEASGAVLGVGRIPEKLALRGRLRPRARLLVAPEDATPHPLLAPVPTVDEALARAGLAADVDVDKQVREVMSLDREGRWPEAAPRAAALVDHEELTETERVQLWLVLLSAANHSANPEAQARWSARLAEAGKWGGDEVDVARVFGVRAVSCVDALDPDAAAVVLDAAGHAWSDAACPHVDGPRALLATLRGDLHGALALRRATAARALPDERPRCLGDLADALLRVGQPEEALEAADRAIAEAESCRRRRPYLRSTRPYLDLHRARALAALGRAEEAEALFAEVGRESGLDPALRARLALAERRGDLQAVRAERDRLPEWARPSKTLEAVLRRAEARLGDAAAAAWLAEHLGGAAEGVEGLGARVPY